MARRKKVIINGVWITKYALTIGIFYHEQGEEGSSPDMVCVGKSYMDYYHKSEWFRSFGEAKQRAEIMRKKKIVLLKKSLAEMESLSFEDNMVILDVDRDE